MSKLHLGGKTRELDKDSWKIAKVKTRLLSVYLDNF
jgi:hypothetical protein